VSILDIQRKFFRQMTAEEKQRWGDAELQFRLSDLRNARADDFSLDRAIKAAMIRRHWIIATPQQTYELVQQAARRLRAQKATTRAAA
jgi:hypothetical protein